MYQTTLVYESMNTNFENTQSFADLALGQALLEAVFDFGRNVTASRFRYEFELV